MKLIKRILFSLLACVCFICASKGVKNIIKPPKTLTYSETIQFINQNKIESIELYSNDDNAQIYLKGEKTRYITNIPNEQVFAEFIQENISEDNNFEITRTKKSKADKVIFYLLTIVFMYSAIKKDKKEESEEETVENSISELIKSIKGDYDFSDNFQKSEIKFSDVAGLKEEKAELMEVVDFLKNPDKFIEMGAKIPKGILLSGAPGNGKTLLAKAVAGEADVAFLSISGPEFDEKYVGVGASRIRKMFKEAQKNAPCIIFIDEIDAVGKQRDDSDRRYDVQTIEQLLIEMDGFTSNSYIIILAATNRLEDLDSALIRPGRFDRNIIIHQPDVTEREEILKIHAKNKKFASEVDLAVIARNTSGFSGAELENLLNEAAIMAVQRNITEIGQNELEDALKKIVIGLQKKGRNISQKEKTLVAYHEAGHTVASLFLSTQANVKEVSIIFRGTAGGYTWQDGDMDKSYISKTELTEELIVLLAGRAAEQVFLNDISTGASSDLQSATNIAKEMICTYGMNEEIGPISLGENIDDFFGTETMNCIIKSTTESVKSAEKQAIYLLTKHSKLVDIVAKELLNKETLSGEEINQIFTSYKNNCTE